MFVVSVWESIKEEVASDMSIEDFKAKVYNATKRYSEYSSNEDLYDESGIDQVEIDLINKHKDNITRLIQQVL